MDTHMKSALNQVRADTALIDKTRERLTSTAHRRSNKLGYLVAFATLLLVLSVGGIWTMNISKTAVAYVGVDINPSIEISINRFGHVIEAMAYNNDGEMVIGQLDLSKKSVEEAVRMLVMEAISQGYVWEDGTTVILVTAETDDEALIEEIQSAAGAAVQYALDASAMTATVYMEKMSLSFRASAEDLDVSPAKYNMMNQLLGGADEADIETYQDVTMADMVNQLMLHKELGDEVGDQDQLRDRDQDQLQDRVDNPDAGNDGDNGPMNGGNDNAVQNGPNQSDVTISEDVAPDDEGQAGYQSQNGLDNGEYESYNGEDNGDYSVVDEDSDENHFGEDNGNYESQHGEDNGGYESQNGVTDDEEPEPSQDVEDTEDEEDEDEVSETSPEAVSPEDEEPGQKPEDSGQQQENGRP